MSTQFFSSLKDIKLLFNQPNLFYEDFIYKAQSTS